MEKLKKIYKLLMIKIELNKIEKELEELEYQVNLNCYLREAVRATKLEKPMRYYTE